MCKETFAGYQCVCGSGFISHVDAATGEETCLDINECLTIDAAQLDANCTCERCACKNIFGSYQCVHKSWLCVPRASWHLYTVHSRIENLG